MQHASDRKRPAMSRWRVPGADDPSNRSNFPSLPDGYDVAQVCLNGHVVNSSTLREPQFCAPHCSRCGEKTITACPHCKVGIRGRYWTEIVVGPKYHPPAHCHACGKPLPWTERALESAREAAMELEGVSETEREALAGSIEHLMTDTPKTQVAVTRAQRILAKAGHDAYEAFKKVATDIVSEAVRKQLFGG